ncbi:MAG: matrixin family metalloprotease [Terriglobia bacterium]|jgi:hypothetical protein
MMNRQKWAFAVFAWLGICSAAVIFATTFQLLPVNSSDIQRVTWPTGNISWSLNPSNSVVYTGAGTLANEMELTTALDKAFSLWSGAQYQGANVNTLAFTQGADNSNTTFVSGDCVNSIGFTESLATGIIGETEVTSYSSSSPPFNYPCSTGATPRICPNEVCISDADIEFNRGSFFYTPGYSNPPNNYFDFQTVATHEIGHLIGLDHSGLANAVMYPYGDSGRGGVKYSLAIDDEIGSAALYGNSAIVSWAGGIKGAVTVGGSPAFGAHVVAIDSATGNVVTDTLSDANGNYHLRMFQGNYFVLVLPLATDTSGDSSTNGVTSVHNYRGFANAYPGATVQTGFTGKFY